MSAHTPGPWTTYNHSECCRVYAGHHFICIVDKHDNETDNNVVLANAHLIAAAPELLAALQHLMRYDFGDSEGAIKARAAIAKATEVLP